jgi:hypothetical protein
MEGSRKGKIREQKNTQRDKIREEGGNTWEKIKLKRKKEKKKERSSKSKTKIHRKE